MRIGVVLSLLLASLPAFAKIKLTPTIEVDVKGKDKLKRPIGDGSLIFSYKVHQDRGTYDREYMTVRGTFSGDTIKDTRVELHLDKKYSTEFEGDIVYKVEYDKSTKTTILKLEMLDNGKFRDEKVCAFPPMTYTQIDKNKPEVTFEPSNFLAEATTDVHYLHSSFPYRVYRIDYREPRRLEREEGKQIEIKVIAYISQDGFRIIPKDTWNHTIVSSNGSNCNVNNYDITDFVVALKDSCLVQAEVEKKNRTYSRDEYIPHYTLVYPNGDKFKGSIDNEALYNVLNEKESNGAYDKFLKICDILGNSTSADIALKDGTLTTSSGDQMKYTNGFTDTELSAKINEPKVIQVNTPGSLLSAISPDELKQTISLAIVGSLDDNDLRVLGELGKNIVNLDLSLAHTVLSDKTRKERREEAEALSALFGLMGAAADAKYDDFKISTLDYANVKAFTTLVQKAVSETKAADKNCIIPKESFKNLPYLKIISLPIWCSKIEGEVLMNCKNLEKVILPPHLESIGTYAFAYCSKLNDIKFPATLNWIKDGHGPGAYNSGGAFLDCTSLRNVDLSECTWSRDSWGIMFEGCKINILKLPHGIKNASCSANTIYLQEGIKSLWVPKGSVVYCTDMTPPSANSTKSTIENCTFYVPKGSITAYYAEFGKNNKIIEY